MTGYIDYHSFLGGGDLAGSYGLGWTFEAEGGKPRFGAIFAHPLELAASMLITTSIGIFYLISTPFKTNRYKYLGILICCFVCVLFAYSRASLVSLFIMLGFIALILKQYKILIIAFWIFVLG